MSPEPPRVALPFGAWTDLPDRELAFPPGWRLHRLDPEDAPAADEAAIARAFAAPVGGPPLTELARGRRCAVIAVDDLTRPTPVHRFLPRLLDALAAGGLGGDAVTLLVGTAAHRPMTADETARKLGPAAERAGAVVMHDFMGPDVRFVGHVAGGPVYLNRHFLEADLRIVVGGVIPHNETGFGGGAKMVVPGVAGRLTIAHFHGSLPPREVGSLEAAGGRLDRRAWSEAVARQVGVHAAVCAVMNGRAELAGLWTGDPVEAHRAAARRAREIGRTPVPRALADRAQAVVVNAFPLDTDPIQMGKSITIAKKFDAPWTVAVNAASDGVFYHGMGMGSGVDPRRLLRNLPGWLREPRAWSAWLRGLARALPTPVLAARTCYFHMNHLAYAAFAAGEGRLPPDVAAPAPSPGDARTLVWSERFPDWGFRRKYRGGHLFRDWAALVETLGRGLPEADALVFPCAPLQLPELVDE